VPAQGPARLENPGNQGPLPKLRLERDTGLLGPLSLVRAIDRQTLDQSITMSMSAADRVRLFLKQDLPQVEILSIASGLAAVYTARCPERVEPNEDAVALVDCGPNSGVIAVADGFGGQPAGEQAAQLALEALTGALNHSRRAGAPLRTGILDGFEQANEAVMHTGVGAATTLAVLEIDNGRARPYHVGDSTVVVVGQRGKLKLQTVAHSPVGYAVEAGWLEQDEALHHEDLHIVSNMVGSANMRIEIGSSLRLRPRDTALLGSDGLFDNLPMQEILELIRKGPLPEVAQVLSAECDRRMRTPETGQPSKPDDLTFVLYRPRS
jgi:serine/threonine protein phosphatase PrpC